TNRRWLTNTNGGSGLWHCYALLTSPQPRPASTWAMRTSSRSASGPSLGLATWVCHNEHGPIQLRCLMPKAGQRGKSNPRLHFGLRCQHVVRQLLRCAAPSPFDPNEKNRAADAPERLCNVGDE